MDSSSENQKTLGERRVRIDFNVTANDNVTRIKEAAAKLIDLVDSLPCPAEMSKEQIRLRALAMTAFEEGAMWAVKAATA